MIKAIIFDCFGVLVGRGFDETYRVAGGNPSVDHEFIEKLLYKANSGSITQQEFHFEITRQLGISEEQYVTAVNKAEQPNEELLRYIEELKRHYKTAVLSNANVGVVSRKIGEEWIKRCFDSIVVSAEVGAIKPERRIYEIAAEKLGVQIDECVFIDDKKHYCEAAEAFGMRSVLYQNFEQAKKDLVQILAA